MKKYMLLALLVLVLATPASGWSQGMAQDGEGAPPAAAAPGNAGGAMGGAEPGQNFEGHKAKILRHLNEHLSKVQQQIACVQSAENPGALHACMPQRKGWKKGQPQQH